MPSSILMIYEASFCKKKKIYEDCFTFLKIKGENGKIMSMLINRSEITYQLHIHSTFILNDKSIETIANQYNQVSIELIVLNEFELFQITKRR